MVDLPAGWRGSETARQVYRESWCLSEGLEISVCGPPPDPETTPPMQTARDREAWCRSHAIDAGQPCLDAFADIDRRFQSDWTAERASIIADLPKLDLAGRDLRRASARGVTLAWANLGGARLEGADRRGARLEGADLIGARLEGANLRDARLEGATLVGARLQGADLGGVRLDGANLGFADLEGAYIGGAGLERAYLAGAGLERAYLAGVRLQRAYLGGARLEGAILGFTDLRNSNWAGASSGGSPAHSADFRGAQDLSQAQLEGLIGSADTLLPEGVSDTGEPWLLWSCWDQPPADLDRILENVARYGDDPASLRGQFVCGPNNPRVKTGTRCAIDLTREQCHDPTRNPYLRP